jgi:hypothetical protein
MDGVTLGVTDFVAVIDGVLDFVGLTDGVTDPVPDGVLDFVGLTDGVIVAVELTDEPLDGVPV